jgi:RNA polymerase sigma-70 factor (ECF subfamily)
MAGDPSAARFPTTHWSRVVAAGGPPTPEARAALAELCGAYWYPIGGEGEGLRLRAAG